MRVVFLNNWNFNTSLMDEGDTDFVFDLFRIEYSWRYYWIHLVICNFEFRISWKGKPRNIGM